MTWTHKKKSASLAWCRFSFVLMVIYMQLTTALAPRAEAMAVATAAMIFIITLILDLFITSIL